MRLLGFVCLLLVGCHAGDSPDADGRRPLPFDLSRAPCPDLLSPDPGDLRAPPPDLAPDCVFDRDCGSPAIRCCAGHCAAYLDRDHCGGCGRSCGADPAMQCCGGGAEAACVSVRSDADNCSMCGAACPTAFRPFTGKHFQLSCCDGSCVNPYTDPLNCGGCGTVCPATLTCCDQGGGGLCVCSR